MLRSEGSGSRRCLPLTLSDGSSIDVKDLLTTMEKLMELSKNNKFALYQFVKACKEEGRSALEILGSKVSLSGLVEEDGTISKVVKQVVQNGVALEGGFLEIINPVKEAFVTWNLYRKMVGEDLH